MKNGFSKRSERTCPKWFFSVKTHFPVEEPEKLRLEGRVKGSQEMFGRGKVEVVMDRSD